MNTASLETCRWCQGPHPIEHCPAVMAAFVKGYDPYQGNAAVTDAADPSVFRGRALTGRQPNRVGCVSPRKLAGLCAREGCNEARWHGTPYCHAHRLEMVRESHARRRLMVNEQKRAAHRQRVNA